MDMALIQGAISSIKLAGDIAQGFLKLNTTTEVQGRVIDLQNALMAAQRNALAAIADQTAMVDEVRLLKEEIAGMKAWETQKQRYKLQALWEDSAMVYALKKSMSESEPAHWICAKCYEDGIRTILQPGKNKERFAFLFCPRCKSEIQSHYRSTGSQSYAAE